MWLAAGVYSGDVTQYGVCNWGKICPSKHLASYQFNFHMFRYSVKFYAWIWSLYFGPRQLFGFRLRLSFIRMTAHSMASLIETCTFVIQTSLCHRVEGLEHKLKAATNPRGGFLNSYFPMLIYWGKRELFWMMGVSLFHKIVAYREKTAFSSSIGTTVTMIPRPLQFKGLPFTRVGSAPSSSSLTIGVKSGSL